MAGTDSFADTVAAHLSSNWNTDSAQNPTPELDNYQDKMAYKKTFNEGHTTGDWVITYQLGESRSLAGWGHENIGYVCDILIRAGTTNGRATNVKQRLVDLKNEVVHILNSQNHKITGFTYHFAREYEDLSDPQFGSPLKPKGGFATGRVKFYAYKPAEAIA